MSASKQIRSIKIEELREHPDNPNRMKKQMFNKLVRHIEKSGNYEPVIVRVFDDYYQILNGHHRVKALKQLGYGEVDCVVWDVDDKESLMLLATLNRLSGNDILQKKSELIKSLSVDVDIDELIKSLPDTRECLEKMITLADINPILEELPPCLNPNVFFLDNEQQGLVDRAIARATDEKSSVDIVNRKAEALVKISMEYIR